MRRFLSWNLTALCLLSGVGMGRAMALDICPQYGPIHDKEILPRIKSGIPFKLLSIAADDNNSFRRIVRIEFDLWNETLNIEVLGKGKTKSSMKDAAKDICNALALTEAGDHRKYQYRLMLNPVMGEGLQRLKEKGEGRSGLLEINWERLAKDLETEKNLIDSEITQ